MKNIQKDFWWKHYFGKRYLSTNEFVNFCEIIGLYGCPESELEEYERRGLLYPVARFEHPENYILINDLPDFRHPIDVVLETSSLPALIKPQNHKFLTWDNYVTRQENNQLLMTTHYYHYWQVYELYRARIIVKGMYLDKSLPVGNFDIAKLQQFLETVSYFQHLYRADLSQMTNQIEFNGDNSIIFNDEQKAYIESFGKNYAMQTLAKYALADSFLYEGLKNLLYLYYQYEQSERYKLAETLKADIWRSVEFMCFALSTTSEAISEQIGYAGLGISNQRTLEILFPNRRREIKAKVKNIIQNSSTQILYLPDNYIYEFLDFIEQTELAIFEYALFELNETFFDRSSWFASESFLRLKALASFPESLMRTLASYNQSQMPQALKDKIHNAKGMGEINKILFENNTIWSHYESSGHRRANDTQEFKQNLDYLLREIVKAPNSDISTGLNLSLSTLLRNFMSHHLVENDELLNGQYIRCVQSILTTVLFIWQYAKQQSWIPPNE